MFEPDEESLPAGFPQIFVDADGKRIFVAPEAPASAHLLVNMVFELPCSLLHLFAIMAEKDVLRDVSSVLPRSKARRSQLPNGRRLAVATGGMSSAAAEDACDGLSDSLASTAAIRAPPIRFAGDCLGNGPDGMTEVQEITFLATQFKASFENIRRVVVDEVDCSFDSQSRGNLLKAVRDGEASLDVRVWKLSPVPAEDKSVALFIAKIAWRRRSKRGRRSLYVRRQGGQLSIDEAIDCNHCKTRLTYSTSCH